jgi:GTP cyclohydrolase I
MIADDDERKPLFKMPPSAPPPTPRKKHIPDPCNVVYPLLAMFGEDPLRPGLRETPQRVLKAWQFMCSGYDAKPEEVVKLFEDGAEGIDGLVFQGGIPLWSNCEHHMLPFFGVAHIGYIPKGRILGLSKFSRIVDIFARRLQVQERLTKQIADTLEEYLKPEAVGVVIQCRHACMEARGIQRAGSVTMTTELRGAYRTHSDARDEFLQNVRVASTGHW